jgi:hypothetical protein
MIVSPNGDVWAAASLRNDLLLYHEVDINAKSGAERSQSE